jgi:hypothetical protein
MPFNAFFCTKYTQLKCYLQYAFVCLRVPYPQPLGGFRRNLLMGVVYTTAGFSLRTTSPSSFIYELFEKSGLREAAAVCVCFVALFSANFRVSKTRECCISVTRVMTTRRWGERERTSSFARCSC